MASEKEQKSKRQHIQVSSTPELLRLFSNARKLHEESDPGWKKAGTYAKRALVDDGRIWAESPYIARKARHLLYVTKTGSFVYLRRELLRLNKILDSIPAAIEMKHAKLREFLAKCPEGTSPADYIRARWKATHFALTQIDGTRLHSATDPNGITAKSVSLACLQPRGHEVWREIYVILDDYVQWFEPGQEQEGRMDCVEIDIDIPTLDLDMFVVIDKELYAKTRPSQTPALDRRGALHCTLQNVEGQEMLTELKELWPHLRRLGNVTPRCDDRDAEYMDGMRALNECWADALASFTDGREELSHQPEHQLFYRVQFDRIMPGLRIGIEWLKPECPKQP
jgi:hypothetical protein